MQPTLEFRGLCAFVSERPDVAASQTLDVLLIDGSRLDLCAHDGAMFLPLSVEDPDNLTLAEATSRKLPLVNLDEPNQGKRLRIVPVGPSANGNAQGFGTANLNMVPEMSQVCGTSTVASGCFSTPPTRPIAAHIQLPTGGDLFCNPDDATDQEWSFAPKVEEVGCYHGRFSWVVQYRLPEADHFIIEVETLEGEPLGSLTLRSADEPVAIDHLCTLDPEPGAPSDDTLAYFALLDPPFAGDQPRARENATCTLPPHDSPGIGCIPFRLSRT